MIERLHPGCHLEADGASILKLPRWRSKRAPMSWWPGRPFSAIAMG